MFDKTKNMWYNWYKGETHGVSYVRKRPTMF
nr:MAG TPA: hypothetical protein [Caudoviricetes sp.]